MEINSKSKLFFSFNGKGSEIFKIMFINWILTSLTFGIYYPWAKEKYFKYLYSSSNLNNDQFRFHGTGKEMFIGMIKALVLLMLFISLLYLIILSGGIFIAIFIFYAAIFLIVPIAIHGSYRYRLSRSSWRSIRFRYTGNKISLILLFLKGFFLILITLGIYSSWFKCNLRKYIFENIYLGDARLKYIGRGDDLFLINFKGVVFSILTFGIYSFWWKSDKFNFYVNNVYIDHEGKSSNLKSRIDAGDVFEIVIINFLLIFFTFGIAYPWVVNRSLKKIFAFLSLEGDVDMNSLTQNAENYKDAVGDDIADFLDIDFFI